MYEGVEVVGGHDEAVPLVGVAPAAHGQVPAQAVLQRASQVLVEDGVEVVVVSTRVAVQLGRESRITVVDPLRAGKGTHLSLEKNSGRE